MISKEQVLRIHKIAIEKFGGANGVRDVEGLESALARPFQAFDNSPLYPTVFEKAAAIAESIITNHPFIDGNKRTGYLLMEAVLMHEGFKIGATDNDLYDFIINISTGNSRFEQIVEWIINNAKAIK